MFFTIFLNEIKYWFGRPALYIYILIFLFIALMMSGSAAGLFDFLTVTTGSSKIVNSPLGITGLFGGLTGLIIFLYPSIIGVAVYRDYKSEMHTILYSYPFTKAEYLFAKFFSGIFIVNIIVLITGLGIALGFVLPGTNPDIVTAFDIRSYLDIYLIYILPNMLFMGAIVFGIVTFTRNISAGFITVLILLICQGFLANLFDDPERRFIAAILDPFGDSSIYYYTRYWTVSEQNELYLPIKGVVIYNRLIWGAVGIALFTTIYKLFRFSQNAFTINFNKKDSKRTTKSNFGGIVKINLPKINLNFSLKNELKSLWKLSNIDFLFIIKSWPFISIVLVGLLINLVGLFELGNIFGTATLPRTWRMLQAGSSFTLAINICTFLYAGILIHRSRISNINQLIDTTPIPNWVLLGSKFLAILKMQLVLLSLIMITGLLFQTYQGFYDYEIGHYIYELLVLNLIYFIIWAFLAFLVQTLISNPYVGLFVMVVLLIGIPLTQLAGIEQSIFKYSQGPGFSYSDMNGYGARLGPYFIYNFYWLCLGIIFYILTALFYIRGLPNNFREKLIIAKSRFNGKYPFFISIFTIIFISTGGYIYYTNNILNDRTSSKEREIETVEWEKKYKKYENYNQPRIVSVNVDVNIFPDSRDVNASGEYTMINKTTEAIDSIFLDHNSALSTFKFDKENSLVSEDTLYNFDIYKLRNHYLLEIH